MHCNILYIYKLYYLVCKDLFLHIILYNIMEDSKSTNTMLDSTETYPDTYAETYPKSPTLRRQFGIYGRENFETQGYVFKECGKTCEVCSEANGIENMVKTFKS